jgi:hypothetical protein
VYWDRFCTVVDGRGFELIGGIASEVCVYEVLNSLFLCRCTCCGSQIPWLGEAQRSMCNVRGVHAVLIGYTRSIIFSYCY